MAKKRQKRDIHDVKLPDFEDPVEERKARNQALRERASMTSTITPSKREKRDYNRVSKKKPGRNRNTLAVKGTVASRDIPIDPTRPEKHPERITSKNTRQFMSKREEPMYSPVVTSTRVDPRLQQSLSQVGVSFKINRSTMPSSMLITMNKRKFNLLDLNELGIVVDRPSKDRIAISSYDLLYLMDNKMLPAQANGIDVQMETFKFFSKQDPNFSEKYLVYLMMKKNGYVVMDGIRYGFDFIIYEEPTAEFMDQLNNIDPAKLGPNNPISAYGMGAIDVVLREEHEITVQEVIKGQHLSDREDMRYFLADVQGERDHEGHLVGFDGRVKLHGIRLNKLNKDPFISPGRDTVIIDRDD